ncbi:MAG: 4-phosphoerythronate dehydrogenase [Chitinispirillia bacterium]|nr:4-phosphoerythronate dehydrogenase [Chitinispirillia bacterium]MCL2241633.1 4-phosphoerythronate dehydrogenase [Chitinispirillia bacterium]
MLTPNQQSRGRRADDDAIKIVADKLIYKVEEAFVDLGRITAVPSGKITKELLSDAGILLVRSVTPVNAALLDGTGVRFVASASIGVDHIDTEYLRERCTGFAHAPGSSADSVAEYVTAAMLEICAKSGRAPKEMKLGIIGAGNVGSRVCRMATALGMECLLNDPPKQELTGSDIYRPLDEVLEQADIVSLHVPLVESGPNPTCHMVASDFVSKMKQGAALINTSRGSVIDEESFKTVCSRLGIIVLDVFEKEPDISVDTLRLADIATPHIAGYSLDGKLRGTDMVYRSAAAFFFKEAAWDVSKSDLSRQKNTVIDLTASKDPVYDGVKSAYSIMADDEQFRMIYAAPKEEQTKFFENLRANYPKRLEFPHFTMMLGEHHRKEANLLRELRFETKVIKADDALPSLDK